MRHSGSGGGVVSTTGNQLPTIKIVDRVNSQLSYTGYALPGALTSDSVWQISRTITQGTITTTEFADSGSFSQVWDDRNTLFGVAGFSNLFSLDFDGVNDYVTFGNNYAYTPAQAFSVSAWIRPQNFAATRTILGKVSNDANVYGWRLLLNTSGQIQTQVRAAGAALAAQTWPTVLSIDTWVHFVWAWTGSSNQSGQRLYINGALEAFTPPGNSMPDWTHVFPFEIGRAPANYFVGNIDEPMIWNKALSDAEVTELYNSGNPLNPTTTSMGGNLVSWWKMGDGDTFPTVLDQQGVANGTMTNMTSGDIEADVP